jgi:hypothetical protein
MGMKFMSWAGRIRHPGRSGDFHGRGRGRLMAEWLGWKSFITLEERRIDEYQLEQRCENQPRRAIRPQLILKDGVLQLP